MNCRKCGACCIAPSIKSYIKGMEDGKPSMSQCIHMDDNNLCLLFNKPERPKFCINYTPDKDFCRKNFDEAIKFLSDIENKII
jgi:uncharacterized protein